MGNFCILVFFERYLSNAWTDPHSTPNFICAGTMSADVPLPALGSIGPWGAGGGGVKNSTKWGVASFVHRTATISVFLSASKSGSICRAQTCVYSGVQLLRSAKAILQGGPKSSKKFRIFHHFQTLCPYISETIKIRGIFSSVRKKGLSLPYATVTCVCTHRSRGSTRWAKNWVT